MIWLSLCHFQLRIFCTQYTVDKRKSMWNSFLSSTDVAKDRLVSVLEKTGEVLHQKATSHIRQNKSETPPNAEPKRSDPTQTQGEQDMTNSNSIKSTPFYMNSASGVGSYIKALRQNNDETTDESAINHRAKEVIDTLKVGWGSVLKVVESTQKVVEKEIASFQTAALLQKGSFRISECSIYHIYPDFSICHCLTDYVISCLLDRSRYSSSTGCAITLGRGTDLHHLSDHHVSPSILAIVHQWRHYTTTKISSGWTLLR
jgi:hypothetical protein